MNCNYKLQHVLGNLRDASRVGRARSTVRRAWQWLAVGLLAVAARSKLDFAARSWIRPQRTG